MVVMLIHSVLSLVFLRFLTQNRQPQLDFFTAKPYMQINKHIFFCFVSFRPNFLLHSLCMLLDQKPTLGTKFVKFVQRPYHSAQWYSHFQIVLKRQCARRKRHKTRTTVINHTESGKIYWELDFLLFSMLCHFC